LPPVSEILGSLGGESREGAFLAGDFQAAGAGRLSATVLSLETAR